MAQQLPEPLVLAEVDDDQAHGPALKTAIVNAALEHLLTTREAEDLIQQLGLMGA